MVFGTDIAVVIRARRGRNVLVQSHGLEMRAVVTAAHEVSAALEGDLSSAMELVDAGVGTQGSAPLACGHLRVVGNRYDAVYRVVGTVLIIAITRAGANPFAALNLVTATTRMLCAECKTVELTPQRVLKRYAQVYLSIDLLVSRGSLDIIKALTDASAILEALGPGGAKARKVKALQDKAAAAVAAQQGKQIGKRLPDVSHRDRFSFATPPELAAISVPLPQFAIPALPGPDRPPAKIVEIKTVELEVEKKEEPEEEVKPIDIVLAPKGPALRLRETWLCEAVGSRIVRAGLSGAVLWASQEVKSLSGSVPFKLQLPEFVDRTVKAAVSCARATSGSVKAGPEYASFVADTLSGHPASTAVLSYGLPATWGGVPPVLAQVSVAIVPLPADQSDRDAAARTAAQERIAAAAAAAAGLTPRKKRAGKSSGGGGGKGGPMRQQQVASPPGAKQQQGAASGGGAAAAADGGGGDAEEAKPRGPPVGVLVTVQYAVPSELQLKTRDLVIDLAVPPEFGAPRKADPTGAEWSPAARTLRWRLGGLYPGYRGCAAAAFRVNGGAAAALALLPALRAVARVRGDPGETLTGLQVAQATSTVAAAGGLQVHEGTSEWSAFVLARPALREGGDGVYLAELAAAAAAAEAAAAEAAAAEAAAAAVGAAEGGRESEAAAAAVTAGDAGGGEGAAAPGAKDGEGVGAAEAGSGAAAAAKAGAVGAGPVAAR